MAVDDRLQAQLSELSALRAAQRGEAPALKRGGGDGTSGGVTDDWKESVNAQLKQLHEDVRRLTGWIIAAVSGPLLAIFGLYVFTGHKADLVQEQIASIQVEQAKLDAKMDIIIERTAAKHQ